MSQIASYEEELEAYQIFSTKLIKTPSIIPVQFLKLAQLARKFLAVPATSALTERVFSKAGKVLRAERCHLLPKNFEKLVFSK